ncbi:glycosyltransferase family 2 protein [Crocinitomix algicola]|uniref:glycosyltransferase family 2 protein n=1 Tax=Crocinitomix algicola TaxID=1740263 RepID=UPI000872A63C|nr:glycosyltransferase family 2 protein [Crocinitomix algicola]
MNKDTAQKLSVVIITYNEEKNIVRCLESVQAVADEIIIVDSYSKDNTESLASAFDVRFIPHSFEGHIEQKNWAKDQAKHPLILSLDADEALDEKLTESILSIKNNPTADGYKMNRLTNYCGKWIHHTGWYPDTKLRLWKKGKGEWTGENPHDEFKLFDQSTTINHLKGDILHYSYHHPEDHDKQIAYFTDIAANAFVKKGKKPFIFQEYLSAFLKFVKCYFIKFGFLDGKEGWIISKKSSYAAYLKYKKIKQLLKS